MLVEQEDELFERTVRYDRVIRIADGSPREKKVRRLLLLLAPLTRCLFGSMDLGLAGSAV